MVSNQNLVTPDPVRLMAEGFIRAAGQEGYFAVAVLLKVDPSTMVMARTHNTDDFYEAMHHLLDLYKKAETAGKCEHGGISLYEN